MSFNESVQVIDTFYADGGRCLYLEGGEPMIWYDHSYTMEDIVSYAKKKGYYAVIIYTNGTRALESAASTIFYFHTPYYGYDELYLDMKVKTEILKNLLKLKDKYKILNSSAGLKSAIRNNWKKNLDVIEAMGVRYLSIGVEALQDRHLKSIERPYTVSEVKKSIERVIGRSFECVNIDYMFDLPGQTATEVEQAGDDIVKMGIHQVATYPLFRFPYTRMGRESNNNGNAIATMFRRRKLLGILEDIFYNYGFERSSVWAFTKKGIAKYCSVTVPLYLGLGASGGSYLKDVFYVNTFSVEAYIKAINERKSPIALSIDLSEEMQMAGWLYWRIYETKFRKSDFQDRFGVSFDQKYGKQLKILSRTGFLKNGSDEIHLSDKGTYWIHAFEDFFSIDYINKLWGTSKSNPWPEKVVL